MFSKIEITPAGRASDRGEIVKFRLVKQVLNILENFVLT